MISYLKFKKIFDSISSNLEPEIEFYFKNRTHKYMLIKYSNYVTFGRCGNEEIQSGEIKYNSLDKLYNTKTIDDILLKDEWENIRDILFDGVFSVIDDFDDIINVYN